MRKKMSNDEWLRWAITYAREAQRRELAEKGGEHG